MASGPITDRFDPFRASDESVAEQHSFRRSDNGSNRSVSASPGWSGTLHRGSDNGSDTWCSFALVIGNIELLKWAFQRHLDILPIICITISSISRKIVSNDKLLEMMKWAHSVGFVLNSIVCKKAAEYRDYQMLIWAVDNGCSIRFEDHIGWDIPSLHCLTYRPELYVESNVEFLKWLISHKFCWDRKARQMAFDVEMYELLVWGKVNGY